MFGDSVLTISGDYHLVFPDSLGCLQDWTIHLTVAPNVEVNIDSNYVPPIIINGVPHSDDFTIFVCLFILIWAAIVP
ncbi:MAG: hypothetical protein IPM82_17445 [Saprospiraceae bacterium]|nr:hypothetical protein [Saprospiraceae bacterium]